MRVDNNSYNPPADLKVINPDSAQEDDCKTQRTVTLELSREASLPLQRRKSVNFNKNVAVITIPNCEVFELGNFFYNKREIDNMKDETVCEIRTYMKETGSGYKQAVSDLYQPPKDG